MILFLGKTGFMMVLRSQYQNAASLVLTTDLSSSTLLERLEYHRVPLEVKNADRDIAKAI